MRYCTTIHEIPELVSKFDHGTYIKGKRPDCMTDCLRMHAVTLDP